MSAENEKLEEERIARRALAVKEAEAFNKTKKVPTIPKAPTKVIEFKLEDEHKRHEAREMHDKKYIKKTIL